MWHIMWQCYKVTSKWHFLLQKGHRSAAEWARRDRDGRKQCGDTSAWLRLLQEGHSLSGEHWAPAAVYHVPCVWIRASPQTAAWRDLVSLFFSKQTNTDSTAHCFGLGGSRAGIILPRPLYAGSLGWVACSRLHLPHPAPLTRLLLASCWWEKPAHLYPWQRALGLPCHSHNNEVTLSVVQAGQKSALHVGSVGRDSWKLMGMVLCPQGAPGMGREHQG